MEKILKTLSCEIKDIDEADRSFTAVGSTEDIDRDGDRILASGWNLDNFAKNPVVPWAHNYSEPPVARAEKIWVDQGRLMFRPKFPEPEAYPFADTIWKLYKGGFLRAFSVGFRPSRRELVDRGKGERGWDFIEQELWEISACTIPSNPNALVAAKSAGILTEEEEKKILTAGGGSHEVTKLGSSELPDHATTQVPSSTDKELMEQLAVALNEMDALNRKLDAVIRSIIPPGGSVADNDQPHPAQGRGENQAVPDATPKTLSPEAVQAAIAETVANIERRVESAVGKRITYHLGIVE